MAKKRRKRNLRAAKIPAGQLADQRWNEKCPKCESHSTWCIPSFKGRGYTYGCRSCDHEWMDQAARESAQRKKEDAEMAAKKKAAKKTKTSAKKKNPMPTRVKTPAKKKSGERDSRIPKVGTVLKAKYKGKEYTAKVTAEGFEFKGKVYTSISKVGSVIMGGKACNGYKLFGLC